MSIPPNFQVHFSWVESLNVAVSYSGVQSPALAAERIYGSYAPLELDFNCGVETYAKEANLMTSSTPSILTRNNWLSCGAFC